MALDGVITRSSAAQMAIVYLVLNLVIALMCIAGLRWGAEWLAQLSPPTPEEGLSRPQFLNSEALLSPETAPDLGAMEQLRAMGALGEYLEAVRRGDGKLIRSLHNGAVALGEEITRFLQAMLKQPLATTLAAQLISFQRKEEILRALEENVFLFASTLECHSSGEIPGRMVEALDTILLTAFDALTSKDAIDIDLLVNMTDDRGNTMERLRARYSLENPGHASDISTLHYATTLLERNVWLVRQLALWVREDVALNAGLNHTRNSISEKSSSNSGRCCQLRTAVSTCSKPSACDPQRPRMPPNSSIVIICSAGSVTS